MSFFKKKLDCQRSEDRNVIYSSLYPKYLDQANNKKCLLNESMITISLKQQEN